MVSTASVSYNCLALEGLVLTLPLALDSACPAILDGYPFIETFILNSR